MRDPNRIPAVIVALAEAWASNPDIRLGQLLGNLEVGYYTEDDETLARLAGSCSGCGKPLDAGNCCYLDPEGFEVGELDAGQYGHIRQCCDCYDQAFTGYPEEEP